jgi:hypothetical protein
LAGAPLVARFDPSSVVVAPDTVQSPTSTFSGMLTDLSTPTANYHP